MDINELNQKLYELKEPYLKTINCLDKGFVRLVDFCGSDQRIVQCARVSYGDGTKTVREDKGLIDYLMRNFHLSPFEQVNFTFHVKMPIFIARQLVRHRTQKINEISSRYSVMKDEFYIPEILRMQKQSDDNKQGSSSEIIDAPEEIIAFMEKEQAEVYENYQGYLGADLARELARINLPVSTYTEWYVNVDLRNLFHLLNLRLDSHAQHEVKVLAQAKYDLIKPIVPFACESFERHMLNGVNFSSDEMSIVSSMIGDDSQKEYIVKTAKEYGWKQSKIDEFLKKLL